MRHVIKKQVFEIAASEQEDRFSLHQEASRYYYNQVLPALEKIFDKISNDTDVLLIDKLEIDLGRITWKADLKTIIVDNLFIKLKKEFEDLTEHSVQSTPDNTFTQTSSPEKPGIKKIPIPVNACEQWLYYMQHGVLPWNVSAVSEDWITRVFETLATDYRMVSALRQLITQNEKAVVRIILEHNNELFIQLIEILTAHEQKSLPQFIKELKVIERSLKATQTTLSEKKNRRKSVAIHTSVLTLAAATTGKLSSQQIAVQLIETNTKIHELPVLHLEHIKKKLSLLKTFIETIIEKNKEQKNYNTKEQAFKNKTETKKKNSIPPHEEPFAGNTNEAANKNEVSATAPEREKKFSVTENKSNNQTEQEKKIQPAITSEKSILLEEGIFVQYAGLILLNPFFKFLFKNTFLVEENNFISRETQEKAILLLQYIATGSITYEEYQLAVPKIICGWPLEEPLTLQETLSVTEMKEADDLAKAAIVQWAILKNTSITGLREGFLQRSGKVFLKNNTIYFQIEKNTIDILLDSLPWNLSIMRLPWLKELINVEWR